MKLQCLQRSTSLRRVYVLTTIITLVMMFSLVARQPLLSLMTTSTTMLFSHRTVGTSQLLASAEPQCGNSSQPCAMTSQPTTNIVFIKVHKAGSTTVANLLARYAIKHDLNIALPRQNLAIKEATHCFGHINRTQVIPLAEGQTYNVLFNHMFYNRTELDRIMPPNTFYVAIMRRPLERFISAAYYFYAILAPDVNNSDNAAIKALLKPKSRQKLEKNFRIYNTLLWDTGLPLTLQKDEAEVRKHIEKLDQELNLMMVMEHFQESLLLLKRRTNMGLRDIIYLPTNPRESYNIHNITEEDKAQIRQWQMGEHLAYNHFYDKFWQLIRSEGPNFYRELTYFQALIYRVKTFCQSNGTRELRVDRSEWGDAFSVSAEDCKVMGLHERVVEGMLVKRALEKSQRLGHPKPDYTLKNFIPDC